MPAARKLPDNTTLRQLRAQGMRLIDIAEKYGVTEAGVWKALERAGFTETRATYKDILPWEIADEHKSTAVMDRFRSITKQKAGGELSAHEAKLLEDWLQDLAASDVVVAYHKDAPPNSASRKGGFYYVPRTEQDEWIIREPKSPGA
ncbi:hypothetical protein GD627_11995 [Arthrobacter yangruifuii]|uniref:Uncharacterized protein n=1 Tax=Arthrobacter yangruifuii TaxID=2606616 RepID=A0A5N6MHR6_9MICC|nr:hypothetical protein [Arthrobacter yangruifuii]KAD3515025.1 hypothetical protein GD627_11995 [Arthrobacter yangruifuii]